MKMKKRNIKERKERKRLASVESRQIGSSQKYPILRGKRLSNSPKKNVTLFLFLSQEVLHFLKQVIPIKENEIIERRKEKEREEKREREKREREREKREKRERERERKKEEGGFGFCQ